MRSDIKFAGIIGAALLLVVLVFASFFTVGQNELAVVNRFGEYRYVAGPGLHFKVPLIDGTQAYRTDIRAMSPERGVNGFVTFTFWGLGKVVCLAGFVRDS